MVRLLFNGILSIRFSAMSHRKLHFLWEDRCVEKRCFQLAHAAFGGTPDSCPTARTI